MTEAVTKQNVLYSGYVNCHVCQCASLSGVWFCFETKWAVKKLAFLLGSLRWQLDRLMKMLQALLKLRALYHFIMLSLPKAEVCCWCGRPPRFTAVFIAPIMHVKCSANYRQRTLLFFKWEKWEMQSCIIINTSSKSFISPALLPVS